MYMNMQKYAKILYITLGGKSEKTGRFSDGSFVTFASKMLALPRQSIQNFRTARKEWP